MQFEIREQGETWDTPVIKTYKTKGSVTRFLRRQTDDPSQYRVDGSVTDPDDKDNRIYKLLIDGDTWLECFAGKIRLVNFAGEVRHVRGVESMKSNWNK